MTDKPKKPIEHRRWIACPTEDEYFGDRKASRKERRRITEKDRSKFKKTDQKQQKKQIIEPPRDDLLRGRVLSISSEGVVVQADESNYICSIRGLLKKNKNLKKNLVTVGDFVLFEKISDKQGAIEHVEERKSILSRADTLSRKKEHLIAANIDQVLITGSVMDPPLKPPLLDRYIIAARKGNMDPIIVINKIDLLDDSYEKELLQECLEAYSAAKIPVILLSAAEGKGIEELMEAMDGRTSVFSGQSGVGKSSLINMVADLDLVVGETVKRTKKGAHTTTSAQLIPLKCGGWCIDTPGIKSFGVWDLDTDELRHYFSEISEFSSECKFPNCTHTHEPGCAVKKAVEEGKISRLRFNSYHSLMQTIDEEHQRR